MTFNLGVETFVSSDQTEVALPSMVSAFHMSRPPENPLVLIVAFVAVVVMTIGVIIAMIRSKSDARLTKKRGPRQFGKRRGRGRS